MVNRSVDKGKGDIRPKCGSYKKTDQFNYTNVGLRLKLSSHRWRIKSRKIRGSKSENLWNLLYIKKCYTLQEKSPRKKGGQNLKICEFFSLYKEKFQKVDKSGKYEMICWFAYRHFHLDFTEANQYSNEPPFMYQ